MGDVSELQQAKTWIRTVLLANADITGVVGSRIYADRALAPPTFPYIIFNFQGGSDIQGIGIQRQAVKPLFQIRVVSDGAPTDAIRKVDKRIDDVLQVTAANVSGEFLFSARREAPVDRVEIDSAANRYYHNLGGLYRLWISKA